MANYRRGRINDEMQKELAAIMREVKDPRVADAFISITGVEVTPDLKYAKVYYSVSQRRCAWGLSPQRASFAARWHSA